MSEQSRDRASEILDELFVAVTRRLRANEALETSTKRTVKLWWIERNASWKAQRIASEAMALNVDARRIQSVISSAVLSFREEITDLV